MRQTKKRYKKKKKNPHITHTDGKQKQKTDGIKGKKHHITRNDSTWTALQRDPLRLCT